MPVMTVTAMTTMIKTVTCNYFFPTVLFLTVSFFAVVCCDCYKCWWFL